MSKLPYDVQRCDGKGCPYRDSCKRHTQIALDAIDPNAIYVSMGSLYRPDAACTYYIQEPVK